MRSPLPLLALALLACPAEPPDPPPQPRAPLTCVCATSSVRFEAAPDVEQELEAVFQGDDQARWWFGRRTAEGALRHLRYRSGEDVWALSPGSASSVVQEGEERARTLLQLELRRAVFFWPDGFAWEPLEDGARVLLESGELRVATRDALPVSAWSLDARGVELERFDELTWADHRGRAFPASLRLSVAGSPVWRETVTALADDCEYASFFFTPPDRRPEDEVGATPDEDRDRLLHLDVPARAERRLPLAAGTTWDAARARCAEELARARAELGSAVESAVEVDAEAAPVAVLLLLDADAAEPPTEGWTRRAAGPAISVLVGGAAALTPGRLRALRGRIPAGSAGGSVYVRVPAPESGDALPWQLVQRLEPR